MRKIAIPVVIASLVLAGAASFPAQASAPTRSASAHSAVPANTVYYAEGTIRPVKQPKWCLTYPINPAEGDRVFWYPCTKLKNGHYVDIQLWYTEKVLGIGSISMLGFPWVMGKAHSSRDNYARVWKLAEQPKMHFYTSFHIVTYRSGWIIYLHLGNNSLYLTNPRAMKASVARVKAYYAKFAKWANPDVYTQEFEFVPGFKEMAQEPGR